MIEKLFIINMMQIKKNPFPSVSDLCETNKGVISVIQRGQQKFTSLILHSLTILTD